MYQLDRENLDERQEQAILLLVEGKTMNEVAAEVGVNRTTIYRWKTGDALFIAELNRLKQSLWEAGESLVLAARAEAIMTAVALLAHEDVGVRLRAIDAILRLKVSPTRGSTTLRDAQYDVERNQRANGEVR